MAAPNGCCACRSGSRVRSSLDLYRSREEITLSVGPYRRNIVLPHELQDLEITSAKFEEKISQYSL